MPDFIQLRESLQASWQPQLTHWPRNCSLLIRCSVLIVCKHHWSGVLSMSLWRTRSMWVGWPLHHLRCKWLNLWLQYRLACMQSRWPGVGWQRAASGDIRNKVPLLCKGNDHQWGLSEISSFLCLSTEGGIKLAHSHNYYFQVQGQLAITGAQWCDFYVYTPIESHIERIVPDRDFWHSVKEKFMTPIVFPYYTRNRFKAQNII